ncbi:MAG: hypothetical protein JWL63_1893 [Rhodocyclales bacterium]|nr:hypothetical protein [Rhodocyclales bacterium]
MRRGAIFKAGVSVVLATTLLAGCSTQNADGKVDASLADRGISRPGFKGSFLPQGKFQITPTYGITYVDMILIAGAVALVYQIVDPTAPNWDILEKRLPNRRVQYSLRMQMVHIGGEGEARQILARRAAELAREEGMTGYQIQSYSESIDSRIFLPRRTAEAEVIMVAPVKTAPVIEARPPLASL